MKTTTCFALVCALGCAGAAVADELYDYAESLDEEFTVAKKEKVIRVSVMPRLLERALALHVQDAIEKKESRKQIVASWKPIMKKMLAQGYVFELDFDLLDRNLDSGVEVSLGAGLRGSITLENNLGERALMYKCEGDKAAKLDFMYPEMKLMCFFNTKTEQGTPLLRKGVMSLKLRIAEFTESLPELEFAWSVPLQYADSKRPLALTSRFGRKPLRTIRTYKKHVYIEKVGGAIDRVKRKRPAPEPGPAEEKPKKKPETTRKAPAKKGGASWTDVK